MHQEHVGGIGDGNMHLRKRQGSNDMRRQLQKADITGTNHLTWEITDRERKRDRRVRRLKKERRQKCLTAGLALAVIACMLLICAVSYNSITVQANTGFKYYAGITVESGETLWSIADRYIDCEHYADKDTYIAEVESINHLDEGETLFAGQFLVIPYYSREQ
ncbi:MAG: LysM peptidoglycan-binding domain-containing protein [Eubacterium sp.]|nr:LysM peptidoglycan-binding domain-containing protein [Eubacterium sp.]MCM1241062.1 LysM peptidoglycan-binding domain-containing protein [Lachnospiraceae bacterium]MCM1304251.1 LysM peptidoglycan-binding domain-containing protein [Butyrivibrio sp.]MCM1345012.1 LysM peptidoglycan-binding domain-containing protein [Muribaculaceae bacterium]MCM1409680.1 LysM peptidoglycan-binding domain-containing protein [Lachnospiraceae bacterium]